MAGADAADPVPLRRLWTADLGHRGHDLSGHAVAAAHVVPSHVVDHQPPDWGECEESAGGSSGSGATRRRGRGCTSRVGPWCGLGAIG